MSVLLAAPCPENPQGPKHVPSAQWSHSKLEGSGSLKIILLETALTVLMMERHLKVKTVLARRAWSRLVSYHLRPARLAKNYPGDPEPLGVLVGGPHCTLPGAEDNEKGEPGWQGGDGGQPEPRGSCQCRCSPRTPRPQREQWRHSLAGVGWGLGQGRSQGDHMTRPHPVTPDNSAGTSV